MRILGKTVVFNKGKAEVSLEQATELERIGKIIVEKKKSVIKEEKEKIEEVKEEVVENAKKKK